MLGEGGYQQGRRQGERPKGHPFRSGCVQHEGVVVPSKVGVLVSRFLSSGEWGGTADKIATRVAAFLLASRRVLPCTTNASTPLSHTGGESP